MTAELFEGPRMRIERARETLQATRVQLEKYFAERPYRQIRREEPNGMIVHAVRFDRRPDKRLAIWCAEIVEHLRSALDLAVSACAIANGNASPKDMGFPFCGSADKFGPMAKGRCKGVPQPVIDFLKSTQPFKGGDELLYSLNEITQRGKHVALNPVGNAVANSTIHVVRAQGSGEFSVPGASSWDDARQEVVIARCSREASVELQWQLMFAVEFRGIPSVRRKDVIPLLESMASKVESIVNGMEEALARSVKASGSA